MDAPNRNGIDVPKWEHVSSHVSDTGPLRSGHLVAGHRQLVVLMHGQTTTTR
jgi:hypothetical protein